MEQISGTAEGLEEKLKKATCEMLSLFVLEKNDMYINEIAMALERLSGGAFTVVFPYAVIYRMERQGYIQSKGKHVADDGRIRQFYEITPRGHSYLQELLVCYDKMEKGISAILHSAEGEKT